MTQADRVHSTPPTNTSVTRRGALGTIAAATATVALANPATALGAPATVATADRRALESYASWLFMERRILCDELWPEKGAEAENYNFFDNAGSHWHFRGSENWRDLPQPSTRAAAVLDHVGVEWRKSEQPDPKFDVAGHCKRIEIVAAYKELFKQYVALHSEWAALGRAAFNEATAQFGSRIDWGTSNGPAWTALEDIGKRNGWQNVEEMDVLLLQMEPIEEEILAMPSTSMDGLKAKVLLAIRTMLPGCDGQSLEFDRDDVLQSLLNASAGATGVGSILSKIEISLAAVTPSA